MEEDDNTEGLDLGVRTAGKSQTSSSKSFVSGRGRHLTASLAAEVVQRFPLPQASGYLKSSNGLSSNIMRPVWEAIETTKKL